MFESFLSARDENMPVQASNLVVAALGLGQPNHYYVICMPSCVCVCVICVSTSMRALNWGPPADGRSSMDRSLSVGSGANDYFIPQTMLLLLFHTPNYFFISQRPKGV